MVSRALSRKISNNPSQPLNKRRRSAVFGPADIPDLALWLDAADVSTITEVAGAVSQWDDKSVNGNDATQGTGTKQPTTGTRDINDVNVLDFDGGDELILPSALFSLPNGNNTVFAVSFRNTDGGNRDTIIAATEGGGSRINMRFTNTFGNIQYISHTGPSGADSSGNTTTIPNIIVGQRSGSSLVEVWVNGGTSSTSADGAAEDGVDGMLIGSQAGTNPLTGVVAEIIIYDRALSDAEKNRVGNYLDAKWGISWTNI